MKKFGLLVMCILFSFDAWATDITLLTAGIRNEKIEVGQVDIKSRSIALGLGLENSMGENLAHYFDFMFEQISYSGDYDVDDATNFQVGGGLRHYFSALSPQIVPYVGIGVHFVSEKHFENVTQTDQSGIFYGMNFGLKFLLGNLKSYDLNDWQPFFTIDFPFFNSALASTSKEKQIQGDGSMLTTSKTSKNELYIDNHASWENVVLGIGLRI